MSLLMNPETHHLTVQPDFDGERAKALGVFLADLLSPGVTAPGDLAPHNWESVDVQIAPDVSPMVLHAICDAAGVEINTL